MPGLALALADRLRAAAVALLSLSLLLATSASAFPVQVSAPSWGEAPRFVSSRACPQSALSNLYAYCGGDPVNRMDPTGLKWLLMRTNDGFQPYWQADPSDFDPVDSGQARMFTVPDLLAAANRLAGDPNLPNTEIGKQDFAHLQPAFNINAGGLPPYIQDDRLAAPLLNYIPLNGKQVDITYGDLEQISSEYMAANDKLESSRHMVAAGVILAPAALYAGTAAASYAIAYPFLAAVKAGTVGTVVGTATLAAVRNPLEQPQNLSALVPAAPGHPLAGRSVEEVIEMANQHGLTTERDGLVLWSGLGRANAGVDRSTAFATQTGGQTLEMTPGGRWLHAMQLFEKDSPFTRSEAGAIWDGVSAHVVAQASGQVRAVLGYVQPWSTFRRIELPGILDNPAITGLDRLFLDPSIRISPLGGSGLFVAPTYGVIAH